MSEKDAARIVPTLIQKTQAGELTWDAEQDIADDMMTASTSRFFYFISSRDGDRRAPFTFEVWARRVTPEGKPNNVNLLSVQSASDDEQLSRMLENLYSAATRAAVGLSGDLASEVMKDLGL